MSDLKLCRICVRKDVKMYEHNRFQLQLYYKEITGSKMSYKDCLPKWFCFECAALLHKFHKFKTKCHNGQKELKKLLDTGFENHNSVGYTNNFTITQPQLQIISAIRNKSVKTYTLKHITHKHKTKFKNKHKNFTEVFIDVKTDTELDSKLIESDFDKIKEIENITEHKEIYLNDNDNDDDRVMDEADKEDTFNELAEDFEYENDKSNFKVNTNEQIDDLKAKEKRNNKDKTYSIRDSGIERSDSVIERADSVIERTDSVIERVEAVIERKNMEIDHHIANTVDKPNLDNKFQRSVKKKFLDENHWTKITLSDEEATRRFQAKSVEPKYLRADYKCTDCYRTFSQEDMMKRHIKLRHCESLGPNECRHCRMRFKWKSRLQKHLKEHYTIYKCLRCELSFPVEISAFQHDYSHNGVTWTCAHCGQGFRHSSTYYTHLRKHKSKFVCALCGVSFVSEFGLFMHKRVKHVINEDSKDESSDTYCKVCDIKFDTLKAYEEHFAESALHATEVSDGTASLPLKTRCTKRRVPRITTNCTICSKTFSTYAAFSKHHLSIHPEEPLPKPKGDSKAEQRQVCEVCGLTLASAWSLVNHLNTHTRDKRYSCNTCGLQLSSRSVLQRHQATHSQEKNFVCDLCDKRFSHRSGLRLHLRTHERDHSPTRSRRKKPESQNVIDYFKNYGSLAINYR